MKTFITTIALASTLFIASNAHSQAIAVSNTRLSEEAGTSFSISGPSIKQAANGFAVSWQASNQFSVASYELQLSEDNNHFSTVKRRTSGPEKNVTYQVQLTNTLILANPVYFRIKVITLDGTVSYTDSKRVRIE